jgi:hypothetical protein
MAFDDLTESQKQLVINLVENIATGSFDSEFLAIGTLAGWSIDLYGKDGAASITLDDFTKTDLIALAEEGYITLIASDKYSYTASLKPKAYDQYKLFKNPPDSVLVFGDKNTISISNPFGDNQLTKIAESSKELVAELQKNYELSRKQANLWFTWTLGVALFGFVLLAVGAAIAFTKNLSFVNITSISGLFTEFIAVIFFRQGDQSNKRQDTYHRNLLKRQQILDAVQLASLINDNAERDRITEEIVKSLLGVKE